VLGPDVYDGERRGESYANSTYWKLGMSQMWLSVGGMTSLPSLPGLWVCRRLIERPIY